MNSNSISVINFDNVCKNDKRKENDVEIGDQLVIKDVSVGLEDSISVISFVDTPLKEDPERKPKILHGGEIKNAAAESQGELASVTSECSTSGKGEILEPKVREKKKKRKRRE